MRDRRLLYAAAFLRAVSTGAVGVLLGIHLVRRGLAEGPAGLVIAAGLGGCALAALAVTLLGRRLGTRRALVALAILTGAGTAAVGMAWGPWFLAAFAFLGMVNGMGRDRGAALVLEQATLPETAADADRTRAFAWYNVCQDAGHAAGGLLAALSGLLSGAGRLSETAASSAVLVLAAALVLSTAALYLGLSPAVETRSAAPARRLSRESRRVVLRISSLFALDSLGGGFVPTALLALFFHERFGAGESAIGLLFLGARVANALSHLAAAWLARKIGLVRTMVFTHVPSSILLATVVFAPSFPVAAILFLLREGLVEMDVPTRQSYVMAVVRPHERLVASGTTHLVRLGAWAVAPAAAGFLMQGVALATPLLVASGAKILYDVLLFVSFRSVRPPEETFPPPGA